MTVDIFALAEFLVQNLKPIEHKDLLRAFGLEDLEDFHSRMTSIGSMCLIAVDGSDIKGKTAGGYRNHAQQYNLIVCKPGSNTDPDIMFSAVQECTVVTKEIEAYLLRESQNENNTFGLFRYFEDDSVEFSGVGPIGDNFYGSMLTFTLTTPKAYTKNNDLWL